MVTSIWLDICPGTDLPPGGTKPLSDPVSTVSNGVLWHSPKISFTISAHEFNYWYYPARIRLKPIPHLPETNVPKAYGVSFQICTLQCYALLWFGYIGFVDTRDAFLIFLRVASLEVVRLLVGPGTSELKRLKNMTNTKPSAKMKHIQNILIRNIKMYLPFIAFLNTDITQVVEILPKIRQELIYSS